MLANHLMYADDLFTFSPCSAGLRGIWYTSRSAVLNRINGLISLWSNYPIIVLRSAKRWNTLVIVVSTLKALLGNLMLKFMQRLDESTKSIIVPLSNPIVSCSGYTSRLRVHTFFYLFLSVVSCVVLDMSLCFTNESVPRHRKENAPTTESPLRLFLVAFKLTARKLKWTCSNPEEVTSASRQLQLYSFFICPRN